MSAPGKDGSNYPANSGAAYQQQQPGYFPPSGTQQQQQQQQYPYPQQQQQYAQQQQYQQQQYSNSYDANGLAHQLQNQHLNASRAGNSPASPQRPRTSGSLQAGTVKDDYVVFQRDDSPFTSSTRERAKALKVKVELHYNQSVGYAVERNQRYVKRLWPLPSSGEGILYTRQG